MIQNRTERDALHRVETKHMSQVFEAQQAAFSTERYPTFDARIDRLVRLRTMLEQGSEAIVSAVSQDFGHRSPDESRIAEIAGTIAAIDYAIARVRRWMRPSGRHATIWFLPAGNQVIAQPVGVVGIIAPWNYPVNLAFVPLVSALAAGNRVMIKMSELSPATSEMLADLAGQFFNTSELAIVGGDAEEAAYFSSLPFGHLLFTGSSRVGRMVMSAAAQNLTPVTLELGGKCPAIVDSDYDLDEAAKRILWGKTFNAAQTCVAPDYVIVPKGKSVAFVEAMTRHYRVSYPEGALSSQYTSIIDERGYARLMGLVDTAKRHGAEIRTCEPITAAHHQLRKFPLTFVLNPSKDSALMQHEIFGPVLPVLEHDGLDDALLHVNQGEHPLALYYFGHSSKKRSSVLKQSLSGGVAFNDVMLQFLQVDMAFGGVGASGFGRYHGREGFETFSHLKSVFTQRGVGSFTGLKLLYPPYGRLGRLVTTLMGG
jgi:coniferyl-aldehyde dehydrogenase